MQNVHRYCFFKRPVLSRDKQSLEFSMTKFFMIIFCTGSAIYYCGMPARIQFCCCSPLSLEAMSKLNSILSCYGRNVRCASQLTRVIHELCCVSKLSVCDVFVSFLTLLFTYILLSASWQSKVKYIVLIRVCDHSIINEGTKYHKSNQGMQFNV